MENEQSKAVLFTALFWQRYHTLHAKSAIGSSSELKLNVLDSNSQRNSREFAWLHAEF